MQIAPTAPVVRAPILLRRRSPLNPLVKPTCAAAVAAAPATTTATHLSNLNRVLRKQPPLQTFVETEPSNTTDSSPWSLFSGDSNPLNLSAGPFSAGRKPQADETDMSPRSLVHLHRFLSDSPRPSPRGSVSHRWRDLHGAGDWSGLLDPLDEDLRRELVRIGEHVQATYQAFNSNPSSSSGHDPYVRLPPDVSSSSSSYRITRHLYATSSIRMPRWVDDRVPWLSQRRSWIGYVAVCECQREIRRLGRRDIVIALRGTATCLEWAENLRSSLVDIPPDAADAAGDVPPKVVGGFLNLFKTPAPDDGDSLSESVVEEVRRLVAAYPDEQLSITITGHSLGAALALLVADELSNQETSTPPIAVFSFGGPRVGNRGFADRIRRRGVKVLRVVNEHDVVTRVPGVLVSEEVNRRVRGALLEGAVGAWGYWHVGSELRVDSRNSPYLRPDADPGCCHDLEAYLHLVDGFLGSHCPFRANAKRSVLKLMCLQGANMKKLYTSKAAALGVSLEDTATDGSTSFATDVVRLD